MNKKTHEGKSGKTAKMHGASKGTAKTKTSGSYKIGATKYTGVRD